MPISGANAAYICKTNRDTTGHTTGHTVASPRAPSRAHTASSVEPAPPPNCTGCGLCVEACLVDAPGGPTTKAINLAVGEPLIAAERDNIAFFETLPNSDRSRVDFGTVRGTQFLEPLFEFSDACSGCGETPCVKLLSQLFGDRLMVANATGCSSTYGGSLPTTPWTSNAEGRGPAWSNSLFEDNAEFGLGFRLAADGHADLTRRRLTELPEEVGADLVDGILSAPQLRESELRSQPERVAELLRRLSGRTAPAPNSSARFCRASCRLIAMIRSAPSCFAARTPGSPTAPSPTTATVLSGPTAAATAANQPVPSTSEAASRLGTRSSSGRPGMATAGPRRPSSSRTIGCATTSRIG